MSLFSIRDVRLDHADTKRGAGARHNFIPGMYAESCDEPYTFGKEFNTGNVNRQRFDYSGAHDRRVVPRCECGMERTPTESRCTRCGSQQPAETR